MSKFNHLLLRPGYCIGELPAKLERSIMVKTKLLVSAFVLICSLWSPLQAAPVRLVDGTLNTANDLTRIGDGSTIYEFLDLTATYGLSIADAVNGYSSQGFRWANGGEVATLLEAFGLDYGITAGDQYVITREAPEALVLSFALGPAPDSSAALGWIDDMFSEKFQTYACILCVNGSFVSNRRNFYDPNDAVGTFLVRDNVVPEPGTLALLAGALIALMSVRRRQVGSQPPATPA